MKLSGAISTVSSRLPTELSERHRQQSRRIHGFLHALCGERHGRAHAHRQLRLRRHRDHLTAILAGAIQKLFSQLSDLASTVASFADHFTTRELTFTRATGDEIDVKRTTTDTLCVRKSDATPVCVTGDQLAAVLSATNQTPQGNDPLSTPASAEPPPTDTATSTDSTSSPQAAATSSPPTSEPSTSPEPTEAATSSPAVINSPPLVPEDTTEYPAPAPSSTAPAPPEPTPATDTVN